MSARAATIESPTVPMTGSTMLDFLGASKTAAGKDVTEVTALGMSAVWRAVTVTSGVAAMLPLHAYRLQDGVRVKSTGWGADLLDEPHPDMTPFELWETVYAHRMLWGNAYLRILRDQLGRVRQLWPIHPGRVQVGRETEVGSKVYSIDGGAEVFVGDDKILHIPAFGYDGVCGASPVRIARQSIGLGLAAEEYGAKLFGSGSLASGILQTEQRLTPDQADALARRWKQKQAGLDGAHSTIILDRGARFQQLTIPPQDAQFLESRRFQITEVCRWFGLPPFLMFETEKSTSWGTGLEQQALGWVKVDLARWLTGVEQRVTRMLRPGTVYARYSVEGLLRGDSAARAAFYRQMWELGALSTNEIRAYEEQAGVVGGDQHFRPLNFGPLDAPAELPAPTTTEVPADA
jgi:HK97 family phage portal protein